MVTDLIETEAGTFEAAVEPDGPADTARTLTVRQLSGHPLPALSWQRLARQICRVLREQGQLIGPIRYVPRQ